MAKRLPGIQRHARDGRPVDTEADTQADPEADGAAAKPARAKKPAARAAAARKATGGAEPAKKPARTKKSAPAATAQEAARQAAPGTAAPAPEAEPSAAPASGPASASVRAAGEAVVRRHVLLAAAGGAVPVPLLDIAAVAAAQIAMVADLCRLHDVAFSRRRARAIVYALLGGAGLSLAGVGIGASVSKLTPLAGALIGMGTMSALSAAITAAMGQSFLAHFEEGGTLADADAQRMRSGFRESLRAEREARTASR